jgi:hypothetical protein
MTPTRVPRARTSFCAAPSFTADAALRASSIQRSRSCRIERRSETMRINHEETKNAKREHKNLRALRFFVVDFLWSLNEANLALPLVVGFWRSAACYNC